MSADPHRQALDAGPPARRAAAIPGGWSDVARCMEESVAAYPNDEALIGRHHRYTYAALDASANAGAAALAALGVKSGDRVAASAGNHPDMVIAFLAVQRIGAIWVGINRPLAGPEKAFQLKDSGAKIFLADLSAQGQIEPLRESLPDLARIIDMEPGETNGWLDLIAAHAGAIRPDASIDPEAPAAIAYTSGTTGHPKGAVHSQHNMMVVAATTHSGVRGAQHQDPRLRRGVTIALTILNMMILDAIVPLSAGGVCICIDRADALGIAEWVRDEGVQTVTSAPTTVFDLLTSPQIEPSWLESLTFAMAGGANVTDELRSLYRERFGKPLLGGYGLTEAPTAVAGTVAGRPLVPGSAGRAYEHIEIGVRDQEGRSLSFGETGEICVRATTVGPWADVYRPMLGYWGRPAETATTLRDGWLNTGDIGLITPEGDIFIKDRLKEIIIRGGANIYPAEIERVLATDPRVRDVAVVGKPDARLGEVVAAFVELAEGVEATETLTADLRQLCLSQLARYKSPEVWRFEGLPRNAMNKIIKARLRELL